MTMSLQYVAEMKKVAAMQPVILSIPSSSLASKESLGNFVWLAKTRCKKHWESDLSYLFSSSGGSQLCHLEIDKTEKEED